MMRLKILQSIGIITLLAAFLGLPDLTGRYAVKVIDVLDGDTIDVELMGVKKRIRLLYIDAPEVKQMAYDRTPIGRISRDHLLKLLKDKRVEVEFYNKGRYGRWLGLIFANNQNINQKMVLDGMAVVYHRIDRGTKKNKAKYQGLELIARSKRFGLWSEMGFDYPWEYRRLKRKAQKVPKPKPSQLN
jgi:micrococcal nuclease